jgi:hypothetical protein
MSMSKKDYVAIADALNDVNWQKKIDPITMTVVSVSLAELFLKGNPRFQYQTFMLACFQQQKQEVNDV